MSRTYIPKALRDRVAAQARPGVATPCRWKRDTACGRPRRGVCSPGMGGDVTQILDALGRGDQQAAAQLWSLVYTELRRLAARKLAREAPGQTLQPTALVHEAYLRLMASGGSHAPGEETNRGVDTPRSPAFAGRGHFFAAAAEAMRRILVERARRRLARKRRGRRCDLDPDRLAAPAPDDELLALDEALTRLAERDPRKAKLVELRHFAGLTADEAAAVLGVSPATADRDWAFARAWLYRELRGDGPSCGTAG